MLEGANLWVWRRYGSRRRHGVEFGADVPLGHLGVAGRAAADAVQVQGDLVAVRVVLLFVLGEDGGGHVSLFLVGVVGSMR